MEVTFDLKLLVDSMDTDEQVECLGEAYEAASDGARFSHRQEVLPDCTDAELTMELERRGYSPVDWNKLRIV